MTFGMPDSGRRITSPEPKRPLERSGNALLQSLEQHAEEEKNLDGLLDNPETQELVELYARTKYPNASPDANPLLEYIRKYKTSEEIPQTERNEAWNNLAAINAGLENARFALGDLSDTDVKSLGDILRQSVPGIPRGRGLEWWLRGIAVAQPQAFAVVSEEISKWKGSARDHVAEKRAEKTLHKLYTLGKAYGIEDKEMDRYLQMEDVYRTDGRSELLVRLERATGRISGWQDFKDAIKGRRVLDISRAQQLHNLIRSYNKDTAAIRQNFAGVLGALTAVDTKDAYWARIPESLQLMREETELPEGKKPHTLEGAREAVSPEAVDKAFRTQLKLEGGDQAVADWDKMRRTVPITDLWNRTYHGSGGRTFGDAFNSARAGIEGEMKHHGFLSALFGLLFGALLGAQFDRARESLPSMAR